MKTLGSTLLLATALVVLGGCAGKKVPARWATGGGRLDLVSARWTYDGEPVELRPRGDYAEVLVDGDVELVIDRVGRVYTKYQHPIGVLEPDGRLVGPDQVLLGTIGSSYAALPGKANAWLALGMDGAVMKFDEGGAQKPAGRWFGCAVTPYAQQACLLVSYMLFFDDEGEVDENVPRVPLSPIGGGVIVP